MSTQNDRYEPRGWAGIAASKGPIAAYLASARHKVVVPEGAFETKSTDQTAVVIGAGVAGLTAAYELLHKRLVSRCIILEAHDRTGGRNFSVRPGHTIQEEGRAPQVCQFECEPNEPYPPYLNAGPGRIPSAHVHLLDYLHQFNVPLEVYVMDSRSNKTYVDGSFDDQSVPNRRIDNDTRGWIAQVLYRYLQASETVQKSAETEQFMSLLKKFGNLQSDGQYTGSNRSGYTHLPGVGPGQPEPPLPLSELLGSEFWSKTSFYQPQDFLWQPTLFQPVGGMDHVVMAFEERVKCLGGEIQLSSVVTQIRFDEGAEKYIVTYQDGNGSHELEADYCLSNVPIPLLRDVLQTDHFTDDFQNALHTVYEAQYGVEDSADSGGYKARFLADTTKVGWQAKRNLWQSVENADGGYEAGEVPIFGGISWSTDQIVQIWYPSDNYHGEFGVLTGAYNFQETAFNWGDLSVKERLKRAREGAKSIGGEAFAEGLKHGLAIAWQKIAHIKGGWANWHAIEDEETRAKAYNSLIQGDNHFYIVGDQLSALPGWQEGAVVSAINAVNRIADGEYFIPELDFLPNTRFTVEAL